MQGKSLLPRLADLPEFGGRDNIAQFAWWGLQGGMHQVDGFRIYPAGMDPYGNDVIGAHTRDFDANIVVSLIDVWVMHDTAEKIKPALWLPWCVTDDTLISMADSTQRKITDVRIGDEVCAANDGESDFATVTATQKIPTSLTGKLLKIKTSTGRILKITADNLMWANSPGDNPNWVAAGCLSSGDMVYCNNSVSQSYSEKGDYDDNKALDGERGFISAGKSWDDDGDRGISASGSLSKGNQKKSPKSRIDFLRSSDSTVDGRDQSTIAHRLSDRVSGRTRGRRGYHQHSYGAAYGAPGRIPVSAGDVHIGNGHGAGEQVSRNSARNLQQSRQENSKLQTAMADGMVWIPVLSASQTSGVSSDNQTTAGADCNKFHRESVTNAGLQFAVHTGANTNVRDDSGFEPEIIVSILEMPLPPFVYDLTTTRGNFVANGVLIHNCPIDHDPIPDAVLSSLQGAHTTLAYAKWGADLLTKAGVKTHYIPHGIETTVYCVNPDVANVRKFKADMMRADNQFLSVIVAANKGYPDRKAFQVQVRAWANFAKDKPDARLYIHTEPTPMYGGIDFAQLLRRLDIADKVIFPDRYGYYRGFPPEFLALVYNAADVLLANSMSEGFGIPIIEAQACGTPVITTNATAMPELVRAGYIVDPADMFWTPMNSWQAWPDVHGIQEALEETYARWRDGSKAWPMAERLRTSAQIHDEYSWDNIVRDYWAPFVEQLATIAQPTRAEQQAQPVAPVSTGEPVKRITSKPRGKVTAVSFPANGTEKVAA